MSFEGSMSDQHKQHSDDIVKKIDADLGGLRGDIILSIDQAQRTPKPSFNNITGALLMVLDRERRSCQEIGVDPIGVMAEVIKSAFPTKEELDQLETDREINSLAEILSPLDKPSTQHLHLGELELSVALGGESS